MKSEDRVNVFIKIYGFPSGSRWIGNETVTVKIDPTEKKVVGSEGGIINPLLPKNILDLWTNVWQSQAGQFRSAYAIMNSEVQVGPIISSPIVLSSHPVIEIHFLHFPDPNSQRVIRPAVSEFKKRVWQLFRLAREKVSDLDIIDPIFIEYEH